MWQICIRYYLNIDIIVGANYRKLEKQNYKIKAFFFVKLNPHLEVI